MRDGSSGTRYELRALGTRIVCVTLCRGRREKGCLGRGAVLVGLGIAFPVVYVTLAGP